MRLLCIDFGLINYNEGIVGFFCVFEDYCIGKIIYFVLVYYICVYLASRRIRDSVVSI